MDKYELSVGKDLTKVNLLAFHVGNDLVVWLYNQNPHIGAVAVGDYDHTEKRASCSVITRLGHKDDVVASEAAHIISKSTRKPVCVVAGIHVDNIAANDIDEILANVRSLLDQLCSILQKE
jgi:hypothetical protein